MNGSRSSGISYQLSDVYSTCRADAAGIFLHINEKFTIGNTP
jgi:hypothetical protein